MGVYADYNLDNIRNPELREIIQTIMDITTGHDHDGSNSKSVTAGTVGDGTVTNAKLATDVKVGSLASLNTTAKSSVQAAINELVSADSTLSSAISTNSTSIGTLSSLTTSEKTSLVGAINELNQEISALQSTSVTTTNTVTLTNKTLTSPIMTTQLIDDGDAGCTLTSSNQTHASATATIPDMTTSDTFVMLAVSQTLTNKTLTSPILTTPKIDDGDAHCTITSSNQTAADATATIPDMTTSDTFCMLAVEQTLTNKTLTTPKLNDGDEGCTITSSNQTASDATATIPDMTTSDTFVMLAVAQTMTNKTLTAPVVTSPDITFGVSSHDYSAGTDDWTLSAGELKEFVIFASNAGGAVNAIATPTANKMYLVRNNSGAALTFKASGQTGVSIATGKAAFVIGDGSDFTRVTNDASF